MRRGKRGSAEKEEAMKTFFDIQKKKLEFNDANDRSRAKKVEVKQKEVDLALISKELQHL